MTHYYISANNEKGFEEISEIEWNVLIGQHPMNEYADQVYRGKKTIDEVPEEYRTDVETIIANKIAKWGEYKNQKITSNELQTMIEEVL